jgi:hypothetical protein
VSGSILSILALSNGKICAQFDRTSFCDPSSRCLARFQLLALVKNDTPFYCRSSDSFAEHQVAHLEIFLRRWPLTLWIGS